MTLAQAMPDCMARGAQLPNYPVLRGSTATAVPQLGAAVARVKDMWRLQA